MSYMKFVFVVFLDQVSEGDKDGNGVPGGLRGEQQHIARVHSSLDLHL